MPYKNTEDKKRYDREYYKNNKDRMMANARANYHRNKHRPELKEKHRLYKNNRIDRINKFIRRVKEWSGCKDCGVKYPWYILQFDHLYDKTINISQMPVKRGFSAIKEEIRKCEVVCANCHFYRTHNRRVEACKKAG